MKKIIQLVLAITFLIFNKILAQSFQSSGLCQRDKNINCNNSIGFLNDYKRAVFTYNSTIRAKGTTIQQRSGNCTGTLINRYVNGDQLGYYFITANHCLEDGKFLDGTEFERLLGENFIFTFNFQSPSCDDFSVPENNRGEFNGVRYQHVSRVNIIDRIEYGDFALLRIETPIPPHFNVFYAGWSANLYQFSTPYRVVHDPKADLKKLSETPFLSTLLYQSCHWVTYSIDVLLNTLFGWVVQKEIKTEQICTNV